MNKQVLCYSKEEVQEDEHFYDFDSLEKYLQDDEIAPEEEGFMRGYLQAEI